jgi:predicted HicB family RNase H-like nuclease
VSTTKARMGRPPLGDRARDAVFTLRLSKAERSALNAAAERTGMPVTQWAREALLAAAAR